jgi:chromosome partitioning protein
VTANTSRTSRRPNYPAVVAVVNLKGGVGKTTLCVNLAYGLAFFRNLKVLIIDLDPQANATQYLMSQRSYRKIYLTDKPDKLSAYELYQQRESLGLAQTPLKEPDRFLQRIYDGESGYLDLVASKLDLSLLAFQGGQVQMNDQVRWLLEAVQNRYDIVLIDCPPTVSRMLMAGFEASEFVLVPIKPDFLSSIGLPLLNEVIKNIYPAYIQRRPDWMNPLKFIGIVYTMYDQRLTMTQESAADVAMEALKMGCPIFQSTISNSTKFSWSSKHSLPIFRTEPRSRYAHEIQTLVDEFYANLSTRNQS